VIAFNPTEDLAVLRVKGLGLPALELAASPAAGDSGAILGYPENGPFDVQPGRIGQTQDVLTQNAYGEGPVTRLLTPLRGLVRPGNSGGPLLNGAGEVLTTVFAGTVGGGPRGGYGVANSTVREVLGQATAPVRTGHCVE
jgi:S1-C subfamily serine protease